MGSKSISIGEAIKFGWGKMKANLAFTTIALIIVFVLPLAISLIIQYFHYKPLLLFIPITIALQILNIICSFGFIKVSINVTDDKKPGVWDLFPYKLFWRFLGASLLFGLIVMIGTLFFIVPGIILTIRLYFFPYLILDKDLGAIESLKKSWAITKGLTWNLFLLNLILVCIGYLGVIALIIGLFATIPTAIFALAFIYRNLITEYDLSELQAPELLEEPTVG